MEQPSMLNLWAVGACEFAVGKMEEVTTGPEETLGLVEEEETQPQLEMFPGATYALWTRRTSS
jgi:hypothetical protein